jgi:hypothetical protein
LIFRGGLPVAVAVLFRRTLWVKSLIVRLKGVGGRFGCLVVFYSISANLWLVVVFSAVCSGRGHSWGGGGGGNILQKREKPPTLRER